MLSQENLVKFESHQIQEITQYFNQYGYVIVRKLINVSLINQFLDAYNVFKWRFYPLETQDTHQIELLEKDEYGFLIHSVMNPKDLVFTNRFSRAAEQCITSPDVAAMLSHLSGRQHHTIFQSMFFDKSTGTVAHQDHYYLDTDPAGHMIAAWFALEDIHPDAGCFYVMPESHRGKVVESLDGVKQFDDHENFVERTQALIEERNYEVKPCPLNKGDVLLWHPFTIHGAFKNKNPQYSRKSLTAHYMPEGYKFRNHQFRKFAQTIPSSVNPDFYVWKRSKLKAQLGFFKRCAVYALQKANPRQPKLEMRGVQYEQKNS